MHPGQRHRDAVHALHGAVYLAMGGQIIDATVVAAPRQKLRDEEKVAIPAGHHRRWHQKAGNYGLVSARKTSWSTLRPQDATFFEVPIRRMGVKGFPIMLL